MKQLYSDWDSAVKVVKEDHKINFFAKVVTPWNALSIDALIMMLQDKGYSINAFIIIAEHYTAGYMINESYFVNNCSTYCFMPSEGKNNDKTSSNLSKITAKKFYTSLLKKKQKEDILFYASFNHTIPDALQALSLESLIGRVVIPCQSEEGVAAYMGTFDKSFPSLLEIKTLGELRSYFRYTICGRWFYRLLNGKFSSLTLKSTLFGLKPNQIILPYYRRVFDLRNNYVKPQLDKEEISNSIIICTTAWNRSEIRDNEDLRILKNVCDNLSSLGYSLFLKTHPRDSFFVKEKDNLHCKLLNVKGLSIESLCAFCRPKAIISFSSTTLINPKIFWDVPTYCLTNLLNREKISAFYLDEIDSFYKTFKSFVKFPDTVNDLSNL